MSLRQLPYRAIDRVLARRQFEGLREEGLGMMTQRRLAGLFRKVSRVVSRGFQTARKQTVGRLEEWAAPSLNSSSLFEGLEARVMLNAVLAVDSFTLLDNAGVEAGVVALAAGTTAGVTANVTTTNGAPDQLTGIEIALPAGTAFTVNIFMTGTSAASTPNITFTGLDAGDTVDLNIFNEQVNDNAGAGTFTPIGNTSTFTAATYVADSNYTGADPTAADLVIGNGGNFAATGDIGATTVAANFAGGDVFIRNTALAAAGGSIGLLSFTAGVDLSGATGDDFNIVVTSDNDAAAGVTITGASTLGDQNLSITVSDVVGGTEPAVSVSAGSTVTLADTGNFSITSGAGLNLGNVTVGDISNTSNNGASFTIDPGGAGDFAGTLTIGNITISGNNAGNDVNIGAADAAIAGAVSIGNVTLSGPADTDVTVLFDTVGAGITIGTISNSSVGNATDADVTLTTTGAVTGNVSVGAAGITVGDANEADTGSVTVTIGAGITGALTLGNITSASTSDFADVIVNVNGDITGAVSIGTFTATGTGVQAGDFFFDVNGSTGAVTLGAVTLGDAGELATSVYDVDILDETGAVVIGDVTNRTSSNVDILFNSDGTAAEAVASLQIGNVSTANAGQVTAGGVTITAGDAVTGALTVGTVTMGDANEADSGDFTLATGAGAGSLTVGNISAPATGAADTIININGDIAGAVSIGSFDATGTGAQGGDFALDINGSTGAATFGAVTLGDTGENATSTYGVDILDESAAVIIGNVSARGAGSATFAFNSDATAAENIASLQVGAVSTQNAGFGTAGGVAITVGDSISGAVTIASIALGDSGDGDSGDFTLQQAAANNGSFGLLTVTSGISTDGTGGASASIFTNAGTGSIAGVDLDGGAITIAGTGANAVTIGHVGGATAATSLGDIALGDVTISNTNAAADLTIQAADLGNVSVASTWLFSGNGDVQITADDGTGAAATGVIGTVGGTNFDIDFADNTAGFFRVDAADGIGAVTLNTVDFVDINDGGIIFNANSDGDDTGPIGAWQVRSQGNDATNENVFNNNSSVNATDGSTITLAGGSTGIWDATSGAADAGDWGAIIFGQNSSGTAIANSDSGGTILADAGAPSLSVLGTGSQLLGVFVDVNLDGNAAGALGAVNVVGVAGSDSLTGDFFAADFDTFVLQNGHWSANITTNIAAVADQNATTSNVTSIAVQNGNVNQGVFANNFTLDDGFVNGITVANLTPVNADAAFGAIILDNDGANAGGTRSGGLPSGITVGGALTIALLDSDANDAGDGVIGDTTDTAANDIGPIQSGQDLTITTLNAGGDVTSIAIVDAVGTAVDGDATPDIVINRLEVNGNLDSIATGNLAGENLFINLFSYVAGDVDTIDAGLGDLQIPAGLRVLGGTAGSAVIILTDSGTDYILAIDGTWAAGINAATIDVTHTFPVVPVDAADNNLLINDLEGTTAEADTRLTVSTRVTGTAYTAVDDDNSEWDVTGFSDDTGAGDDGQHDFRQIMIEGDARGAAWGADSNLFDASAVGEPVLGDIQGIEIQGLWDNGPVNIFALSLDEIAYGQISTDQVAGVAGNQFSYDNPSGIQGDAVLPPGGNSNGTGEDLEIYTAFTPAADVDVIIPIPDGGSITKSFVGPNGTVETIRFTDEDLDGVVNTVVIDFAAGVIDNMYLFGENFGIEYNAVDPLNPGTSTITDIFYGTDQAGLSATNPGSNDWAIEYLEFSSAIGNVNVLDVDDVSTAGVDESTDLFMVNVGNSISVGYVVVIDSDSDISNNGGLSSYIDDNNDGTGNTSAVPLDALGNPIVAGIGNVLVQGALGPIVSSGGVGSIQTVDLAQADIDGDGISDADFAGLVTDGSAGAITVNGHVGGTGAFFGSATNGSLVVGDRVVLDSTGTIGISGTPTFGGDIAVDGSLGDTAGAVTTTAGPNGIALQQLPSTITGDQVSAPDGIAVNVTAGEGLYTAIVSGKRILVDNAEDQSGDDLSGTIRASGIFGDIWSGDDINGDMILATGLGVTGLVQGIHGNIGGTSDNLVINIYASGASAGDITADIYAAGDIIAAAIDAGSGSGGSFVADIVAGYDGSGSITGSTLTADQDLGNAGHTNVIGSADNQSWTLVASGLQTVDASPAVDFYGAADIVDGGDINIDFAAGLPVDETVPAGTPAGLPLSVGVTVASTLIDGFNEATLPIMQNDNDSISITSMQAGWSSDSDGDLLATNDLDSDLNGTLVAAADITIALIDIDGNATGNDGVAGGHIAAAGMGYKDGNNVLTVGTTFSSGISGTLNGTLSAGMFVPADEAGPNPINPADLGPLQAGTVLTLGEVIIGGGNTLEVGAWDQTATGVNGADGINLGELLDGTESGAGAAYAPNFSVGATHNLTIDLAVRGLPSDGNTAGTVHLPHNLDPATGDVTDVTIGAFGEVNGSVTAADSMDVNFVLSNMDAITAIDTTAGDPSSPSTGLPLNAGAAGGLGGIGVDNNLSLVSSGNGVGGLDVEFYLAGYDYFANAAGADFWASFGFGDAFGSLVAADADPTDGLEVGDMGFALVAAGGNNNVAIIADDDITGRTSSATTDGTPGLIGVAPDLDADVAAGLNVNAALSPVANSFLFPGGNLFAFITAGDDILSSDADTFLTVVSQGGPAAGTGNVSATIFSGTEDQLGASDADGDGGAGNMNAVIIASGSVSGTIDAGDVNGFGGSGGLGGSSGLLAGDFRGGIHAGAGADLNIFDDADNDFAADITANIYTVGNLDVSDVAGGPQLGILAEDAISGDIEVGWGINGGNLLGNVIAEGDIALIEVYGDLGAAGVDSIVFAGGDIDELVVGNPVGYGFSVAGHASSLNTSTFGTVYADVYIGGTGGVAAPQIHIGGSFAPDAILIAGLEAGLTPAGTVFEQAGRQVTFTGGAGTAMVLVQVGGDWGDTGDADAPGYGPDVWLYNTATAPTTGSGGSVSLTVSGNGAAAGLGQVIAVDSLSALHVIDGSVEQVIVDDDIDLSAQIDAVLDLLGANDYRDGGLDFVANSLLSVKEIEYATNNAKVEADLGLINVDFNLGVVGTSIGAGLLGTTQADNVAVWVQGAFTGSITSETGSVGNIVVHSTDGGTNVIAEQSIGDFYVETGSIGLGNVFNAVTGNIGVLSAQLNVDANTASIIAINGNLGGFDARNGGVTATVNVGGSIGLLQAGTGVAATLSAVGSIGVDLDATDIFTATDNAEIYAGIGDISITALAGENIGNTLAATGSISVVYDANGSVGSLIASGDVSGDVTAETGDFLDASGVAALSLRGDIALADVTVGGDMGSVTATLGDIDGFLSFWVTGDNMGQVTAGNDIYDLDLQVGGDLAGITAGDNIEDTFGDIAGAIGNVLAGSNIDNLELEVNSAGNFTATGGFINDLKVHAVTSIGDVAASTDVHAFLEAETGNIGNISSNVGNINVAAIAGGNIGTVTASVGTIAGNVTSVVIGTVDTPVSYSPGSGVLVNVPVVDFGPTFNSSIWDEFDIDLTVSGVSGLLRAGGTIGAVTANGDVSNYVIEGGVVTGVTSTAGIVGGAVSTSVTINDIDGDSISFDDFLGGLVITGVTSVGDITAGNDIGADELVEITAEVTDVFSNASANSRVGITSGNVWVHAINGSVGNITAQGGSIVQIDAVAGTDMGDISASEDIFGRYIAEDGSIGNVITQVGDIGSATNRVVLKANGGVVIDPLTLTYTADSTDPTDPGIGNIYAEIGSIWADVTTGTNVGTVAATVDGNVIGGIAAPIGTVDVLLRAGGNVGGVAGGLGTVIQPDSIVLGRIGLIRNVEPSENPTPITVNGVTPTNPLLLIDGNGVYTIVEVGDGSASVTYVVGADGNVTITDLTYNPNAGGDDAVLTNNTVSVITRTGSTAASPDSAVLAQLDQVTVNGNLFSLDVEGNVDNLDVAGNIGGTIATPGLLQTDGTLGNVHASGDIGVTDGTPGNDTAAPGLTINVGSGVWESLTAGGVNYGLAQLTIDSFAGTAAPRFISWTNTLGNSATNAEDDVIYAYIGAGTATLTVNNGFIETVAFEGAAVSNFTILASSTIAAGTELVTLSRQFQMVQSGRTALGTTTNLVASGPDVVQVGQMVAANERFTLRGVSIEGNVDDINVPTSAVQVAVTGTVGRIFAGNSIVKLNVRDAGVIDAGLVARNVFVAEDVDVLKASSAVVNAQVGGNAGVVNAGRALRNIFVGGSSLKIGAASMTNVQVAGSVGASINSAGATGLGSAFSQSTLARLLGVAEDELLSAGDPGSSSGTYFFGGIQGHHLAHVSVGGSISDLVVSGRNPRLGDLFNATLDDANVFTSIRQADSTGGNYRIVLGKFVKVDGVITETPEGFRQV